MEDKTIQVSRAMERLMARHPHLERVTLSPIGAKGLTLRKVSEFIEGVWRRDYPDEVRITFQEEFLRYNFLDQPNPYCLAAWHGEAVCGVFLAFGQTWYDWGRPVNSYVCTGLTIHPDYRRGGARGWSGGLGQYLWLSQMKKLAEDGIDFSAYWLDMRHRHEGSSLKTFGHNPEFADFFMPKWFYAKPLKLRKTVELAGLGSWEKAGLKSAMVLFPPAKYRQNGLNLEMYCPSLEDSCMEFLLQHQPRANRKRSLNSEEMSGKFTFCQGRINGLCMVLEKKGAIQALLYGYTNPTGEKDAYFQIDGVIFHPSLNYMEKKRFLASCEHEMLHRFHCFSAILPQTVILENPLKYGYVPLEKQALVINQYNGYGSQEKYPGGIFMELR